MAVDKNKLAAFAKSPNAGKKKGGGAPPFGKKGKKGKDHDDDHDEDEEHEDDEHAEGHGDDEETDPGHGGGKKKGNPGGKKGGGGDEHEDDDGDEHHELDADELDEIGERVQNGEGDKRLMKLARGVTEENNPPNWALDESLWEKAKAAVEDRWDEYDEPYAVVAHVYQQMGGEID